MFVTTIEPLPHYNISIMQPRQSWFLGIVIVLLLVFIFFMPSVGMRMRGFLGPRTSAASDAQQLAAENVSLKARIAELAAIAGELPSSTFGTIPAVVYSNYPFNFKNEMTVNAGSLDGVVSGSAVLFKGNLVGIVTVSSAHRSTVQTIFDPNFKLPVRIGVHGYDALFVGGSYPMIESIAKTASIGTGDIVYSAGSGAPYAIPVGEIASVALAPSNLFEEASLSFTYDMGNVQTVEIIK